MGPIEAALLVVCLMLPFHVALQRQLSNLYDVRNLVRNGVVIRRAEVLEPQAPVLGHYRGCAVHASVLFLGSEYRFDRIVVPAYRDRVKPLELFVEPGLIYIKG